MDFLFQKFGSVTKVVAKNEAAIAFAKENFPVEGWQGLPENFTTDWRAAEQLMQRLQSEGFDVGSE